MALQSGNRKKSNCTARIGKINYMHLQKQIYGMSHGVATYTIVFAMNTGHFLQLRKMNFTIIFEMHEYFTYCNQFLVLYI